MRVRFIARLLFFYVWIVKHFGLVEHFVRNNMRFFIAITDTDEPFKRYVPDEKDIVVATYAKSGTNLTMQVAVQSIYRGEVEFEHIHDLVPWPENSPFISNAKLSDSVSGLESINQQRVIKTHVPASRLPYSQEARYLCLLRHPAEALVSAYYFIGGIGGVCDKIDLVAWADLTIEEGFVDLCMKHAVEFWDWRERENVLVWSYRDAVKKPREFVIEINQLLETQLTDEQLEKVVEKSSFDYMREHESQFAMPRNPFASTDVKMVRAGQAGKAKASLLDRQIEAIDKIASETLSLYQSDFPYETFY